MTVVIDEDAIRALVQTIVAIGGVVAISIGVLVGIVFVVFAALDVKDWIKSKWRKKK